MATLWLRTCEAPKGKIRNVRFYIIEKRRKTKFKDSLFFTWVGYFNCRLFWALLVVFFIVSLIQTKLHYFPYGDRGGNQKFAYSGLSQVFRTLQFSDLIVFYVYPDTAVKVCRKFCFTLTYYQTSFGVSNIMPDDTPPPPPPSKKHNKQNINNKHAHPTHPTPEKQWGSVFWYKPCWSFVNHACHILAFIVEWCYAVTPCFHELFVIFMSPVRLR